MKNSVIIRFFIALWNKVFLIYNDSFIERAIGAVCGFFKRKSAGSKICGLFKNGFLNGSFWQKSLIFKIITSPIRLMQKIATHIGDWVTSIRNNSEILKIFDNLLYIPIKEYGIIGLAFSLGLTMITLIRGRFEALNIIFVSAIVIFSGFLKLIPCSVAVICQKSKFLKPFRKLFNAYELNDNKEIKIFKIVPIKIICAVFFVLGIIAGFFSPVVTIISIIAAVAVALIIHNTLFGVFLSVFSAAIMPTMICAGLIALTFLSFIIKLITEKDRKYVITPMSFLIVSFVILTVFSSVTSFNPQKSIVTMFLYVLFAFAYFLIVNTVKTKNQWYNIVITFIISGFLVSCIGIYQNFFMETTDTSWIDEDMFEEIGTRVYSTLENPNVLGQYLVLLTPLAFSMMWSAKAKSSKLILLVITAAMGGCLIFTWSRAAWVGIILAIGFFLLMKDRRWSALCILALIALPFVLPDSIILRITSIGNVKDSSTAYRVSVWIASLRIAGDYWLSGIGLGTGAFERVYQHYALNGAGFALHSHNFYIQLVVEMGILGLVVFLLIIFASYKGIASIKEKNTVNKNISLAIGGALAGYLFQGVAENLWYNYRMVLIFWIYIAILQSGINVSKKEVMTLDSIK